MDDHDDSRPRASRARPAHLLVRGAAEGASKDDGDRESNDLILARLAEARPDDAVLSEESKDDPIRLERERRHVSQNGLPEWRYIGWKKVWAMQRRPRYHKRVIILKLGAKVDPLL